MTGRASYMLRIVATKAHDAHEPNEDVLHAKPVRDYYGQAAGDYTLSVTKTRPGDG